MLEILNFGASSLWPWLNCFKFNFSEAEIMNLESTFSPQVLLPVCMNIYICMYTVCTVHWLWFLFHIIGARK